MKTFQTASTFAETCWDLFFPHAAINIVYLLLLLLIAFPVLSFLLSGYWSKREAIVESFNQTSTFLYLNIFQPQSAPGQITELDGGKWRNRLRDIYRRHNGLSDYWISCGLLMASSAVLLWMCRQSAIFWSISNSITTKPYPLEVVVAIMGGYLYAYYDMILRFGSRDLLPRHLYDASFRILIAVPFAYSLSMILNGALSVPMSFAFGALPTGTLFTILRRYVSKAVSQLVGLQDDEPKEAALTQLPAVSQLAQERLRDVGVGNVSQLMLADPVILCV